MGGGAGWGCGGMGCWGGVGGRSAGVGEETAPDGNLGGSRRG